MDLAVENFTKELRKQGLKEVCSVNECDVILFFFPITSRAGTDIDAAIKHLDQETGMIAASKPVNAVLLYPRHDVDSTIPDSSNVIKRENTFAVDCLFFEDSGLLKCSKNEDAVNKTVINLKRQGPTFYCMTKWDPPQPKPKPWFCDFIVQHILATTLLILVVAGMIIIIPIIIATTSK